MARGRRVACGTAASNRDGAFHPDGRHAIVTNGVAAGAWIFDLDTRGGHHGRPAPPPPVATFAADSLLGLSFSPDGRHLVVAVTGADAGIRRYILDTTELLSVARARATRALTDQECRTYLRAVACP